MSAKGIFRPPSAQGLNFRTRKRADAEAKRLARFAEFLSEHTDAEDIAAGRGSILDPGGNARKAARLAGYAPTSGNGLLQRLRRELGPQAR